MLTELSKMDDGNSQGDALEKFSSSLANAIETYVKSATVKVNKGIPVATTGSAAAQSGTTTEIGIGKLE
ncbi:hypothetical protein [Flammeovirga agarivorans]|uniref:Uncharacterized protein n=1 Tax=Flammeovirga agarivorans TaxID=2726742 RepID=A0A7X8SR40_9BACT|nr:hypothetical protein [Flammeovirga agarivorans]NLR94860.1 hypothetical protein [Flammeovirga agarivorans]